MRHPILLTGMVFTALMAGCVPGLAAQEQQAQPIFRPAAPVEAQTATPTLHEISLPAVNNLVDTSCKNNLTFVQDVTIPDGTEVAPQATMDKRWEVENSGTCNWNASYRARLIAGPEMGTPKELALYPARGGTRAVLRITFKAPAEAGAYKSAWQAFDPQGEPFGDPFFIDIVVK